MSYYPNIPAASDDPSVSQGEIQTNFATINTAFALNHVPLGTGAGSAGKHNFVEMPVQSSAPTTINGEGTLYTKSVTDHATTSSQLFYQPDTSTPSAYVYQLTRTIAPGSQTTFATNPGWSFLPGGMLIQWGTNTCASGTTISFPVTFSTACYSVQMTVAQNTTNRHFAYARSTSTTGFTTTQLDSGGSGETNTFSWIAIGV